MAQDKSVETALKRLEEINGLMESGGLSLEDSLKLYEEGAKIVASCYEKLNQAELKIQEITAATLEKVDDGPDSGKE